MNCIAGTIMAVALLYPSASGFGEGPSLEQAAGSSDHALAVAARQGGAIVDVAKQERSVSPEERARTIAAILDAIGALRKVIPCSESGCRTGGHYDAYSLESKLATLRKVVPPLIMRDDLVGAKKLLKEIRRVAGLKAGISEQSWCCGGYVWQSNHSGTYQYKNCRRYCERSIYPGNLAGYPKREVNTLVDSALIALSDAIGRKTWWPF